MGKRARIRALLGPTAGFWRAVAQLTVGALILGMGVVFSFKNLLAEAFNGLGRIVRSGAGFLVPRDQIEVAFHVVGGLLLLLGLALFYRGLKRVVQILNPDLGAGTLDAYMRRQMLSNGPRIVAIGGGTGLSTLLRGLKQHSNNITAIVTVTDDGGSSGKLISEKGMIPPGDLRNCLVALADAEKRMTDLFQHRFGKDSGALSGHSLGNLLLAGFTDQAGGDFEQALGLASEVLNIRGTVLPSTLEHVHLRAEFVEGDAIEGETAIASAGRKIRQLSLVPADVRPHALALEAIRTADIICIGPGSVYTSVIPNLLVRELADALRESDAPKVYICNVMTQRGESDHFGAADHVEAVRENVPERIFDYVLVNTAIPSPDLIARYQGAGQELVDPQEDRLKRAGYRVLAGDFISQSDVVRHDPVKVAERLMRLVRP